MQITKEILSAKRRRTGNRNAGCYHIHKRENEPVPLRFYIQPLINADGKADREKIVELFNTENYA